LAVAGLTGEASATPNCPDWRITGNTLETAQSYRFDSRPGHSILM